MDARLMNDCGNTIPKVIHYCWFGRHPLPDLAVQCIESWKKYCPDYVIMQWNEDNFDVTCCEYIRQAYEKERWAFVSDYARFKILYENGGIYFDTDVELINPIDDLIEKGPFMGAETGITEKPLSLQKNLGLGFDVAPGLGLAAAPGLGLYKKILDYYEGCFYIDENGEEMLLDTVVTRVTRLLKELGYKGDGTVEKVAGITVYPPEYFCPKDFRTGELFITENTRSIHHYTASWLNEREKKWNDVELWLGKNFGVEVRTRIKRNYLWIFVSSLYKYGLKKTVRKIKYHCFFKRK